MDRRQLSCTSRKVHFTQKCQTQPRLEPSPRLQGAQTLSGKAMASVLACPVQELLKASYREKLCQDSTEDLCTRRSFARRSLETIGRVNAGWEALSGRVKCGSVHLWVTQTPSQGPPKSANHSAVSVCCRDEICVVLVQLSGLRQRNLCNSEFFPASLHVFKPQVFSFASLVQPSASSALKAAQIPAPLAESRRNQL